MENINPQSNSQSESKAAITSSICSQPKMCDGLLVGRNERALFEEIMKEGQAEGVSNDILVRLETVYTIGCDIHDDHTGTCSCTKSRLKRKGLLAHVTCEYDEKKGRLVTKIGKELPIGMCCLKKYIINNPKVGLRLKEQASGLRRKSMHSFRSFRHLTFQMNILSFQNFGKIKRISTKLPPKSKSL